MKILETKAVTEQNAVSFLFEKGKLQGKRYSGKYDICANPACDCGFIAFHLLSEPDNDPPERHKVSFRIDVLNQKVEKTPPPQNAKYFDIRFAKEFVKELKKEDWNEFLLLYQKYKEELTKQCPLEKIYATFPYQAIEEQGITIGYYEILPFAEKIILEVADEQFLINDQYCVRSDCDCTDVGIAFLPVNARRKSSHSYTATFLNYKTKTWEIEREGRNVKASPKELMNALFAQKRHLLFAEHHQKLRKLYKNFSKRHAPATPVTVENKIGRNDPCPCGSGKKYKKCCMLK